MGVVTWDVYVELPFGVLQNASVNYAIEHMYEADFFLRVAISILSSLLKSATDIFPQLLILIFDFIEQYYFAISM